MVDSQIATYVFFCPFYFFFLFFRPFPPFMKYNVALQRKDIIFFDLMSSYFMLRLISPNIYLFFPRHTCPLTTTALPPPPRHPPSSQGIRGSSIFRRKRKVSTVIYIALSGGAKPLQSVKKRIAFGIFKVQKPQMFANALFFFILIILSSPI